VPNYVPGRGESPATMTKLAHYHPMGLAAGQADRRRVADAPLVLMSNATL
jgi:hypothetical protein